MQQRRRTILGLGFFLWFLGEIFHPSLSPAESNPLTILDHAHSSAAIGLRASSFNGDGFWSATKSLASQTNTLSEQRIEFWGVSTFRKGTFLGLSVPMLHRTLDLATPSSKDATDFGLGDAILSFGWRDEHLRWHFRPGLEILWKTPSGKSDLSIEDVDRGNPIVVPLGTGGHDLDLWTGSTFEWEPVTLGLGLGYRKRFKTRGLLIFNNGLTDSVSPRERIQIQVNTHISIIDSLALTATFESFKEVLIFDSRRSTVGQNRSWSSWVNVGVAIPIETFETAINWQFPVAGRSYPDIPPDQFVEREPLLGNRLTVEIRWLFDSGDQQIMDDDDTVPEATE